MNTALLCLLEPRTLAEVAAHTGQTLSATRLLLGHLVNEGRVIPDGSGGYALHPRERARWEAHARVVAEHASRAACNPGGLSGRVHVRTDGLTAPMSAPKRLDQDSRADRFGGHCDDD